MSCYIGGNGYSWSQRLWVWHIWDGYGYSYGYGYSCSYRIAIGGYEMLWIWKMLIHYIVIEMAIAIGHGYDMEWIWKMLLSTILNYIIYIALWMWMVLMTSWHDYGRCLSSIVKCKIWEYSYGTMVFLPGDGWRMAMVHWGGHGYPQFSSWQWRHWELVGH